jgi:hypothetical protein
MGRVKAEFVLQQAYEESRYHRRFHHTVMSLYATFLVALLGFQAAYPDKLIKIANDTWLSMTVATTFLFLVLYGAVIVLAYHRTIATLNSLIAHIVPPSELRALKKKGQNNLDRGLDKLFFRKYERVLTKKCNWLLVGSGHWFFLVSLVVLALCNVVAFFRVA